MIKVFSATEIARLEGIDNRTVANRPDKYIPIRIDSTEGRRTKRGYSVRYIRVSDIKNFLNSKKKVKGKEKNL